MKKHMRGRLWWLGPAVLMIVTLFIWCHSLAPAEQSSAESGRIVALLAPILGKIKLEPGQWQNLVRKAAHMTEFAVLGMAWMANLVRYKAVTWPRKAEIAVAVCMATALIDETIQLSVPGRSGQISDVWIDLLGAVIGIALVSAVIGLITKTGRQCEQGHE